MKKMLLIQTCKDQSKWYSHLIGQTVPFLGDEGDHWEYRSREPAGYINFVDKSDAVVVSYDE